MQFEAGNVWKISENKENIYSPPYHPCSVCRLTSWYWAILKRFVVTQLVSKFPDFMKQASA